MALGIGYLFDDLLIAASTYGVSFTNCWTLSFNLCVSSKHVESNMIASFLSAVAHNNMLSTEVDAAAVNEVEAAAVNQI